MLADESVCEEDFLTSTGTCASGEVSTHETTCKWKKKIHKPIRGQAPTYHPLLSCTLLTNCTKLQPPWRASARSAPYSARAANSERLYCVDTSLSKQNTTSLSSSYVRQKNGRVQNTCGQSSHLVCAGALERPVVMRG